MSHFLVFAMLPADKAVNKVMASTAIKALMAPFDENITVDEYERDCWCVGRIAEKEARAVADEKHGTIAILRESFHARDDVKKIDERERKARSVWLEIMKTAEAGGTVDEEKKKAAVEEMTKASEETEKLWKEYISGYVETEKTVLEGHPQRTEADPTCEDCGGTGKEKTTYNPDSKWDWYRIGGRWDGYITDNEQSSENGFNFGDQHETLKNNSIAAGKLVDGDKVEKIPFAIITPEGQWNEKGKMGWFGHATDKIDQEDWEAQIKAIYEAHPDHVVVALDCHI